MAQNCLITIPQFEKVKGFFRVLLGCSKKKGQSKTSRAVRSYNEGGGVCSLGLWGGSLLVLALCSCLDTFKIVSNGLWETEGARVFAL